MRNTAQRENISLACWLGSLAKRHSRKWAKRSSMRFVDLAKNQDFLDKLKSRNLERESQTPFRFKSELRDQRRIWSMLATALVNLCRLSSKVSYDRKRAFC